MKQLSSLRLNRPGRVAVAAVAAAVVLIAGTVALLELTSASLTAQMNLRNAGALHLDQTLPVTFSEPVDASTLRPSITPDQKFTRSFSGRTLTIRPLPAWAPNRSYTLRLGTVWDQSHRHSVKNVQFTFKTQPVVGVAAFLVDGQPASGLAQTSSSPALQVVFSAPMKESSVPFLLNSRALPVGGISWDSKGVQATLTVPSLIPYQAATLTVPGTGQAHDGKPMTGSASIQLLPYALEPANSMTGVGPGFKTLNPVEVVIENSGAARPQAGFQNADMVYEYLSEYGITRMTALYFNQPASLMRPVRSCRMINAYLDWAFSGLHMCSGASSGTLHWLFGWAGGPPEAAGTINDFDNGNHFFRCGADAPHNVCTTNDLVNRLRAEYTGKTNTPEFLVDPPHADSGLGAATAAPSIPDHCVNYNYDAASQSYLRFDHGTPFTDRQSGAQLSVKNVVVMHVPEHWAGWVEDENGGAQSVWYDMIGSGPAEIYSDGKAIGGTWHFGDNQNFPETFYWLNHRAPYFTDQAGNVIRLNTGLSWVHVIGSSNLNGGC